MGQQQFILITAFLLIFLSIALGDYDYGYDAYEDDSMDDASSQGMVGYDEDGAGFVTVSLYGLLVWQFMSLSFGMCLCGGITMCYNRFSQPNKTQQQW